MRFEHPDLAAILAADKASVLLEVVTVEEGHVGVFYRNGRYVETLQPGRYALWKGIENARVVQVNMRELSLDVSGQEIMTADKVTLRLNAVVTYRVADALAAEFHKSGRLSHGTPPRSPAWSRSGGLPAP